MISILKLLFKNKKFSMGIKEFLTKELAPIAEYIYHGRVHIPDCPITCESGKLMYKIWIVNKRSKILAEQIIDLEDVLKWMNKKEE